MAARPQGLARSEAMGDREQLWREAYDALKWHDKKRNAQTVLDRQVRKFFGDRANRFDSSNCDIYEAMLSPDELRQTERKPTSREPRRLSEPIILLELEGRRYVMDGHNRIRIWLESGNGASRRAIIIAPRPA